MAHALILDDDRPSLEALAELVEAAGFTTTTVSSLAQARRQLEVDVPDIAFVDLELADGNGLELVQELQSGPELEIVVVTGTATVDSAVEALRLGVTDFLQKPLDSTRLEKLLTDLARTIDLRREVFDLRDELRRLGRFGQMVGASQAMQHVYDLVGRVAPTEATVFVHGETGVGKELVAETVHRLSKRSKGPFVAINCGAVQESLIESELFGHEAGSFTGANKRRQGVFERAGGGTLFLDEVTEMPLDLQVKLLRVLESHQVVRVGGEKPIEVDVRLIAATNRLPEEAVEKGKLREDLLYRLMVFPVHVPPLRARPEDIPLLASVFLQRLNEGSDTRRELTAEARDLLCSYSWPGNVRELKNAVERASILASGDLGPECFHLDHSQPPSRPVQTSGGVHVSLGASIADAEKQLILATLEHVDGNKKRAAEILGISLKTLYTRLNRYSETSKS